MCSFLFEYGCCGYCRIRMWNRIEKNEEKRIQIYPLQYHITIGYGYPYQVRIRIRMQKIRITISTFPPLANQHFAKAQHRLKGPLVVDGGRSQPRKHGCAKQQSVLVSPRKGKWSGRRKGKGTRGAWAKTQHLCELVPSLLCFLIQPQT